VGKRRTRILISTGALLAMLAGGAPSVAKADQLQASATNVYEARPDGHVLHVTMTLTLSNRAPSTSKSWDCSYLTLDPYGNTYLVKATCSRRTDYYYDGYDFWVERDATHFKVKADSGRVSLHPSRRKGDWRVIQLHYTGLFYGKTRKITFSYDLPAGGPRSSAERRVSYGFSRFCVAGPGSDRGRVQVVVPSGFQFEVVPSMASTTAHRTTTYDSGFLKSHPWDFSSCLTGDDPTGYVSTPVTTAGGQTVTIESWKDDKTWPGALSEAVTSDYPALVSLLGAPPVGKDLTIRELLDGRLVVDDPATHTHYLSETATTRATATDDLAHLWLSSLHVNSQWVVDGYATWAQHEIGRSDVPCSKPAALPTVRQQLDLWLRITPTSTQGDQDIHAYQRQAACYVISEIAAAIGKQRMVDIMDGLRGHEDPWATGSVSTSNAPLTWRAWADTVTERGYRPAAADPERLSSLLLDYGVADDPTSIAARSQAHASYHALATLMGEVAAPKVITDALARWDFGPATTAISAATAAWQDTVTIGATLPSIASKSTELQQSIAGATTQDELDSARDQAAAQKQLVTAVAGAISARSTATDPLQQLGLLGVPLPADATLLSAVERSDATSAMSEADQIKTTVASARDVGIQRAIGGAVGLVLILGATLFAGRRLRRRGASTGGPGEPTATGTD